MSWLNRLASTGYTLQRYPRLIEPDLPDFHNCDPRYGQELVKADCKAAVLTMPWARQNLERDFAVNFVAREYNLPMSFNAVPADAPKGAVSNCVITVEVAGPSAFYDASTTNVPFTIKASPFQLRGLAAYIIAECVVNRGYIGGFATNKISNLRDYILNPDRVANVWPPSSAYLTVSVTNKRPREPQPGNFDPSIAVFVAEHLASQSRGANNADRARLNAAAHDFALRTQKMYAGGKTTPWWGATAESADDMTYECDANLGAPSAVDCAQVEWSQLGPDEETIPIGAGVVKFLSSNTCQVAISAITAITLNWRQIRIAMDTLFNICVSHPFFPGTGGRAYYGPQPLVSRQAQIHPRQATGDECGIDQCGLLEDPNISGLNALIPGANITVFNQPQPFINGSGEVDTCTWQAILNGRPIDSCADPSRPPERLLGTNSTVIANTTIVANNSIALIGSRF